jgi:hypothetical protein
LLHEEIVCCFTTVARHGNHGPENLDQDKDNSSIGQ